MGVINVQGPISGYGYSVNIAGDTPSPEEQQRIDAYINEQERMVAANFPVPQEQPTIAPPEPDESWEITKGFRRGIPSLLSPFGTSIEEAGRALGIDSIEKAGRDLEEYSQNQIEEEISKSGQGLRFKDVVQDPTFENITDYAAGVIGEGGTTMAPGLAGGLAGGFAGAKAGAALGAAFPPIAPLTTTAGGGVGTLLGVLAASYPQSFGSFVQRREEVQGVDGGLPPEEIKGAAFAAGGAAALEAIAGKVLLGRFLNPAYGNIFVRPIKGTAVGGSTEGLTEVGQQLIERAQAGLPIDSDDAIEEYIEAGVAGGIIGGGIGGLGSTISGDRRLKELDDDYNNLINEAENRARFAEENQRAQEVESEQVLSTPPVTLSLPAPDQDDTAGLLPKPDPLTMEEDAIVLEAEKTGRINIPQARTAIKRATGAESITNTYIKDMIERLIQANRLKQVSKKNKFVVEPVKQTEAQSLAIDAVAKDNDMVRKRSERLAKQVPRLEADVLYAQAYGKDVDGKPRTVEEAQKALDRVNVQLNKMQQRIDYNNQQLQSGAVVRGAKVPEAESVTAEIPGFVDFNKIVEDSRREVEEGVTRAKAASDARYVAEQVERKSAADEPVYNEAYTAKQKEVFQNLKNRLRKIGLGNVRLEQNPVLKDEAGREDVGIEGYFDSTDPTNKFIALAMGVYDPNLSVQEYEARISEVMNHEVIHGLRNAGVFTDKELRLLANAARKTRYVAKVGNKTKRRGYTYLDRARKLNPELPTSRDKKGILSALEEEAVAEMFRDNMAGRLKNIGTSESIFNRTMSFFKSIVGANTDQGFNSVNSIFANVDTGAIGARQGTNNQDANESVRYSRIPNKVFDLAGENGLQLEYPSIGRAINKYVQNNDYNSIADAFQKDPDYKPYYENLQFILRDTFTDGKVPVSRIEGYANIPYSSLPEAKKAKQSKQYGTLNVSDIMFVGNEAEREVIANTEDGFKSFRVEGPENNELRRYSRTPIRGVEEEQVPLQDIRMPIDTSLPFDQVRAQIQNLTAENKPLVKKIISTIDSKFGTKSGDNEKNLSKVTQKAQRPSILANKPWHDVSHIRDTYRFKTVMDDFRDVPAIFNEVLKEGVNLVKVDTNKLFNPKEWGWRIIAFDLRMPNGQLVEYYLPLRELEIEKKKRGHLIFEEWRNKTQEELASQQNEYFAAIAKSYRGYDEAFQSALERMGLSRDEAEASWSNAESSMLDAARNSRRSSGVGMSSPERSPTGLIDPSSVRTDTLPSGAKMTARDVPSSISAKGSSVIGRSPTEQFERNDIVDDLLSGVSKPDIKYSRLTIPLTRAQRDASILDYINEDTGKPLFKKRPGSETLISFTEKLLKLRNAKPYNIVESEQDREEVARIMAAEMEAAYLSSNDAIGWYDSTLKLAKRILSKAYPEISPTLPNGEPNPEYDPNSEIAFDFATAITSNGLSVLDNYEFAADQYDAWKETGRFPVKGRGNQGKSMFGAFELWNALSDMQYNPIQINELLMTELPRGQLNKLATEIFGVEKVKDLPPYIKASGKEAATQRVSVAYLLGPKIGNGFYRNLRGNFEPITMDRWWMRFMNRITGNPMKVFSPELVEKNKNDLWEMISSNELSSMDKDILKRAVAQLDKNDININDVQDIAPVISDIWNKEFFNKAYSDKMDELVAEGYDRNSAQAKAIATKARPDKTQFLKSVDTYIKKLTPDLQEDPRTPQDRIAMRDITSRAKKIFTDATGVDITNADAQALMWYAEKRLYEAGGVRKGRGDDNDYADGAIYVLQKRGISDEQIENTLPDSERQRVSSVRDELESDQEAGKVAIPDDTQEGDFFRPRELVLEERGLLDNLTDEEVSDLAEGLSDLETNRNLPPVQYSRIPTRPRAAVRTPVKPRGDATDYIYGIIRQNGRNLPVILGEGSHDDVSSAGEGLFHIQQRMHDQELYRNSRYNRIEKAIYDLMKTWQRQNYEDGDSIISYPSRNELVLDWVDNLPLKAPPLRLVLTESFDQKMPRYYVKTFYPLLEKKDRMKQPQRGMASVRQIKMSRIPPMTINYSTINTGPADLMGRAEGIRYTKVQDSIKNVLGKFISPEKAGVATEWFFTKFQDDMLAVGKMYDKLRGRYGAGVITQDMDAYFQESLAMGVAGEKKKVFDKTTFIPTIELVASLDMPSASIKALESITPTYGNTNNYFKQIREKLGSERHALANSYLYALHAKERNQRIFDLSKGEIESGSGMSDNEANAIINFVNNMEPSQQRIMDQIAVNVQNAIEQTNDTYIDGGLIPDYKGPDVDPETQEEFSRYDFYVPLRGFSDPEEQVDLAGGGFSVMNKNGQLGKPNMSATGRDSYAGDILANVGVQHHQAVDKAERNKVGRSLLKLLQAENIDTNEFADILSIHPTKRVMVNGVIRNVPDRDFENPNRRVLAVRDEGKEYLIRFFDDRIADAMKGTISPEQSNAVIRGLNSIVGKYASLLTTYNPAFFLSNVSRDIQTAMFNAQMYNMEGSTKSIIKNFVPAYRNILKEVNDKEGGDPYWRNRFKEFAKYGGQNQVNQMIKDVNASKDINNIIKNIVAADGSIPRSRKAWSGFVDYIEAVNTAFENATRVAFFDAMATKLMDQGVPEVDALKRSAFAARNLTTNFGKGGEWKSALNGLYLFYNASMQGNMALFNSLANSSRARKLAGGLVVLGFMLDQLAAGISEDEDEDGIKDYDDLNDYVLSHNFILPDLNGDAVYHKVPMAYGLNILVNAGRVASNVIRGAAGDQGTYTPAQAASNTIGEAVRTINPFGGDNMWTFLSPTVTDLPVELLTNKNFMNSPIYKELSPFQEGRSRTGMYWSTTSPSAKFIANFINGLGGGDEQVPGRMPITGARMDINPDVIEHIVGFLTGGVGTLVDQSITTLTSTVPDAAMNGLNKDMISKTPFLNKFASAVTEKDRSSSYYEKSEDVLNIRRAINLFRKSGDVESIQKYMKKYPEEIKVMNAIAALDRRISQLRGEMRRKIAAPNISDDQKRKIKEKYEDTIYTLINRGKMIMKDV